MFLVIETQTDENDQVASLITTYNNSDEADNKYYLILAAASISNLPKHSAILLDDEGNFYDSKCYKHKKNV